MSHLFSRSPRIHMHGVEAANRDLAHIIKFFLEGATKLTCAIA